MQFLLFLLRKRDTFIQHLPISSEDVLFKIKWFVYIKRVFSSNESKLWVISCEVHCSMPIKWSFSFRQEDYIIAYFGLRYYSYHQVIHSAQHAHNVPICCLIIWGCQLISAVHISWSHLSNSTVTHLPRFLAAVLNMMLSLPLVHFCCCFAHPRHLPITTYCLQIHQLHHFIISSA